MNEPTQTLAQQKCRTFGWAFDEVFRQQYRICENGTNSPKVSKAWEHITIGDWQVGYCGSLHMTRLKQSGGKTIGVLLGIAISPGGVCLGASKTVPGDIGRWVEDLAGRFVVLVRVEGQTRVYLDAAGNLSAVYDPAKRIITSSVALALHDEIQPHPDISTDDVIQKKERYLFGETSDCRIRRARPNHYLDLTNFQEQRHWPRADTPFAELDQDRRACFAEFATRMQRNVTALVKAFSCALPITAGRDSRIILASAYPVLDKIDHFYCYGLNKSTTVDAKLGTILAEHLAIPFQVLSRKSPRVAASLPEGFREEEHQKMLLRTGWSYHMRADWGPFVALSPRADVVLRGTGLEMTRANKWTQESTHRPCDAVVGLRTLTGLRPGKNRSPAEEARYQSLLSSYKEWAATLPETGHARLYDLAHIELMLPAGPVLEYSAYCRDFVVNPMNDRRLYQLAAAVQPRARRRGALVDSVIKQNCPGLQKFPYFAEMEAKMFGDAQKPE